MAHDFVLPFTHQTPEETILTGRVVINPIHPTVGLSEYALLLFESNNMMTTLAFISFFLFIKS